MYGRGGLGLMGGLSLAVFLGGSQVLGVVPKALAKGDIIEKTLCLLVLLLCFVVSYICLSVLQAY